MVFACYKFIVVGSGATLCGCVVSGAFRAFSCVCVYYFGVGLLVGCDIRLIWLLVGSCCVSFWLAWPVWLGCFADCVTLPVVGVTVCALVVFTFV